MTAERLKAELRLSEGRVDTAGLGRMARGEIGADHKRAQPNENDRRGYYFSAQALLVLVCLAASLLLLPLILPPLPPPPFMLLLVPIGILVVLLILGRMPSDVRNIASSYL